MRLAICFTGELNYSKSPFFSYALVASFLTIQNGYAVWVVGENFKLLNDLGDRQNHSRCCLVSQKLKSSIGKQVREQGMSILSKKRGENRSNHERMGS